VEDQARIHGGFAAGVDAFHIAADEVLESALGDRACGQWTRA